MERESNPMEAMCRSGCGFYGNPATDGLCSVCFKEALKKKQQPPQTTPSPVSSAGFGSNASPASTASVTIASTAAPTASTATTVPTPTPPSPSVPCLTRALPHVPCPVSVPSSPLPLPCADDKSMDEGAGSSGGSSAASVDLDADSDKDASKDKKKKNRCAVCRKKVGLTGFECRCGGLFCSVHRYSDKHDCTFDYRELGAQEIRRNNPVVVGEKIHKI